ncbi:MAG: hypothetical protein WAM28_05125, partial [Chlamydiales bacterium]
MSYIKNNHTSDDIIRVLGNTLNKPPAGSEIERLADIKAIYENGRPNAGDLAVSSREFWAKKLSEATYSARAYFEPNRSLLFPLSIYELWSDYRCKRLYDEVIVLDKIRRFFPDENNPEVIKACAAFLKTIENSNDHETMLSEIKKIPSDLIVERLTHLSPLLRGVSKLEDKIVLLHEAMAVPPKAIARARRLLYRVVQLEDKIELLHAIKTIPIDEIEHLIHLTMIFINGEHLQIEKVNEEINILLAISLLRDTYSNPNINGITRINATRTILTNIQKLQNHQKVNIVSLVRDMTRKYNIKYIDDIDFILRQFDLIPEENWMNYIQRIGSIYKLTGKTSHEILEKTEKIPVDQFDDIAKLAEPLVINRKFDDDDIADILLIIYSLPREERDAFIDFARTLQEVAPHDRTPFSIIGLISPESRGELLELFMVNRDSS